MGASAFPSHATLLVPTCLNPLGGGDLGASDDLCLFGGDHSIWVSIPSVAGTWVRVHSRGIASAWRHHGLNPLGGGDLGARREYEREYDVTAIEVSIPSVAGTWVRVRTRRRGTRLLTFLRLNPLGGGDLGAR